MFAYGGYVGKILNIDLGKKKFREEDLNSDWSRKFIGGRGLGARMLFDVVERGVDPMSPGNKLIFLTGPLTGTRGTGSSRFAVVTKSPLTGIYLESICGGNLGSELKFAGYDGIVIGGRAEKPVYITIWDGEVKFEDASHLAGLTTHQTQEMIKDKLGGMGEVACIGPAGERLVKVASILNDKTRAARGGSGAVMGSKNLKAVAVIGSGDVIVRDIDAFKSILGDIYSTFKTKRKNFRAFGTLGVVEHNNSFGMLPTRNYQQGVFEAAEDFSAEHIMGKFVEKSVSCGGCPLACIKVTSVKGGPYEETTSRGPQYETIWAFGPQCGNTSFEAVIYAHTLCDEFGLDTISVGNTIGFAMECYEKGLLNKEQTGGIELKFGNYEGMIDLVKQIASRQGLGNMLADGVKAASKHISQGSEKFAMHVKGLEIAGYDPRGVKGMGLGYAASNRGGCHHSLGRTAATEMSSGNRFEEKGKGALVKEYAEARILSDSLMVCTFHHFGEEVPIELAMKMLNTVTGIDYKIAELKTVGDRINCVERAFNVREGLSRKHDTLPYRLLKEPLASGPSAGHVVNLDIMLDEYYDAMGWSKDGIPTRQVLERLGCADIASELENSYAKKNDAPQ
jgi:aldehyde:ferredoxin oxidoreductase